MLIDLIGKLRQVKVFHGLLERVWNDCRDSQIDARRDRGRLKRLWIESEIRSNPDSAAACLMQTSLDLREFVVSSKPGCG